MWKFVEYQTQETDRKSRQWWVTNVATGRAGLAQSSWQYKKITGEEPEEWDISVLSAAIVNCVPLHFGQGQKKAIIALKDVRNNHIGHKKEPRMKFDEYIDVLKESKDNYKKLLEGGDVHIYVEKLQNENYRENQCFVPMYCMSVA